MTAQTALPGETLTELAGRQLRRDIIAGVRQPGERLGVERLREIYGIGPTPLREALQRLSAEGLVAAEGNRGFRVAELDPEEFADITTARIAVEREALCLSIGRGDDAWEAGVVSAAYLMSKADADGRFGGDAWERANTAFHDAMVAACGSRWLLRIRSNLTRLAERYRRLSVSDSAGRDLGAEHAGIAEAVLVRDAETACRLTEEHYRATEADLREALSRS